MQKIGNSTSTANGAGEYSRGQPGSGIDATLITPEWLNAVQRELVNVIIGAGIALDPNDDAQVLTAIQAIQTTASTWAKLTGKPTMTVGSVGLERANFADDAESSMSDSGLASLDPLIDRLEAGEFDLVGVGRMLITNPEWANQVREGRDHEIRPYSNTHLMALD